MESKKQYKVIPVVHENKLEQWLNSAFDEGYEVVTVVEQGNGMVHPLIIMRLRHPYFYGKVPPLDAKRERS